MSDLNATGTGITTVSGQCPKCKQPWSLNIPTSALVKWHSGELIQNALSMLNPSEREMLMTGICGKCWDLLFGGGDRTEDLVG